MHHSCWLSERVAAISAPCCHKNSVEISVGSQTSTCVACWPRHHSLELCHGTTSKPRRHHLSSQLQLTYFTLPVCHPLHLPQSFPLQGFFICCCFLQPANPLIQSSLCCCCLSCVSFLCILSPGGPGWEAGDDSCISSRSWGHAGSAPLRHCRVCEPQLHRGRNRGCTTSERAGICRHHMHVYPTGYATVCYYSTYVDLWSFCCIPG